MWCLETLVAINAEQAKGKNAVEAYEACNIRVSGNTPISPKTNETPVEKDEEQ